MRTELEVYASRTPQASPSAAIKQATRAMHADLDATKAQVAELTAQLAVRDGMVSELQGQLEALKKTQAASSTEQDTVKSNLSQLKDVRLLLLLLLHFLCSCSVCPS
jgi:chromosome segregation ATPase